MDPRPEPIEKTKEITSNNTMNTIFQKDKIGVGKRKRAVARVFLVPGTGKITINKVSGEKYLQYNTNYLNAIWSPLEKLALKDNFDICQENTIVINLMNTPWQHFKRAIL